MAFIDRSAEDMTGNRGRETDMQQRYPGRESNPGLLQSLGTCTAKKEKLSELKISRQLN